MLWHKCCSINDPGLNRVTELILQNSHYRAKGVALVVTFQVFYVLQQKRRRAMFRQNVADAEERVPAPRRQSRAAARVEFIFETPVIENG